ncbi:MAG TPA: class D beta-lactamase [Xanthobacteraceae bacterium]|nr:class D beta-lactamase [Xanthobacteraceae bacterium]
MFRLMKFLPVLFALLPAVPAYAQVTERQVVVRDDLENAFREIGTEGTFVMLELSKNRMTVVNAARHMRGYLPASTFKIPNALIALETGVIRDASHPVFKWDGTKRTFDAWNKDHTPESAFRASAVWVFQEIAREITSTRMRVYVSQFGYGNRDIGGNEASFWLDGKLRISALQQVEFLERLYIGKLPVNPKNVQIVKNMMFLEKIGDATLRGKTGWIPSGDNKIGWFAGWVERGGETYIFALNLDPNEEKHVAARISIAKALLAQLGALPK